MALVYVRWDVTETHSAKIDIDEWDGTSDSIPDDLLAEHETGASYEGTPDRHIAEFEVIHDEPEPVVVPDMDAFEALAPTDARASYLDEGDIFAEYAAYDVRIVAKRGDHGDTVLITDTEGVESSYDRDEVILVHRPAKENA